MIVLAHGNPDKWPNVLPVQHFCTGFDHVNLVSFFCGSNFLPKIRFSKVYFYKYVHLKRWWFFSPISGRLGIGHIFRTDGERCLLWMWDGIKTNPSTYIFSSYSKSLNVYLLFNRRNIMIERTEHRVVVYLKLILGTAWVSRL